MTPLLLRVVVHGPPADAIERLRAVLDEYAWMEDVHFYSDVMITYQLRLRGERLAGLAAALSHAEISVDASTVQALAAAQAKAKARQDICDVEALLSATFPEGDPDARREIPNVPG